MECNALHYFCITLSPELQAYLFIAYYFLCVYVDVLSWCTHCVFLLIDGPSQRLVTIPF